VKFKLYSKLRWFFLLTPLVISMAGTVPANAVPYDVNLVTAIKDVAKKAIPTVVHVEVSEKQSVPIHCCHFRTIPCFGIFLAIPARCQNLSKGNTRSGSGIIIDAHGYILTNSMW